MIHMNCILCAFIGSIVGTLMGFAYARRMK